MYRLQEPSYLVDLLNTVGMSVVSCLWSVVGGHRKFICRVYTSDIVDWLIS